MNPTPCNREKSEFSRRSFVRSSAAWTIGCFAGCRLAPLRSSYSVPLLGDVHYDRPPIDTFHANYYGLDSVTPCASFTIRGS